MGIELNWLAIAIATIISMVIARVWYSTWGLFGKVWEELTGITAQKLTEARGKKPMLILFATNFVSTLGVTVAISIISAYFKNTSVWLALATGFLLWLGISATTLFQHNTFEMKSNKLTAINNGYQLVLYLAVALVVGFFL